ncbi:IMV membrane protein [Deerpox virus W-1170-84]|uniref:IMV membrane protein n=1 Tax=Deerpox virus (strain W-1170-84) TaxID=305676 RepID=Q08F69_DPV84|nr:IMV membrane protein [Deerpox virus W-1170-84]AUI80674.1 IMv membrane protein [White-tailed deer poxvirus]AYC44784.1 IMV membrane protein [Moosepox virus GoldyGopher14]
MIGDFILIIICVAIIGLIVYGIYNRKTSYLQTNPPTDIPEKYEKQDQLKTGFVDKLKPGHLNSFYKLFISAGK